MRRPPWISWDVSRMASVPRNTIKAADNRNYTNVWDGSSVVEQNA